MHVNFKTPEMRPFATILKVYIIACYMLIFLLSGIQNMDRNYHKGKVSVCCPLEESRVSEGGIFTALLVKHEIIVLLC